MTLDGTPIVAPKMAVHRYLSRFGVVFHADRCKDDWGNIVTRERQGYQLKLQKPAMRSYLAAEKAYGRELKLTGSWRPCLLQRTLWQDDPGRYAHPDTTLHTHGLAIDVHTGLPEQARIRKLLTDRGWMQSRPDDEPWHYSFRLRA